MKYKNKKENYQNITDRAFEFGVKIVKLVTSLPRNLVATEIGRQLIHSGTAIHSILIHADSASSKREFIFYNNKACTEARETEKWIKMLVASNLIKETQIIDLLKENNEIISILVSISKKTTENLKKKFIVHSSPFIVQKGVSILFAVLIMSIILTIGLGISFISLQQTKMMREVGYSVIAFYAADNGIEKEIYDIYQSSSPQPSYSGSLNSASFTVTAKCSASNPDCPSGFEIDPNCNAEYFCIKSIGTYKETRRAIEIRF